MPFAIRGGTRNPALRPAAECKPIDYPKPYGVPTFGRLSCVLLANTDREQDRPCHQQLKNAEVPITTDWASYDASEHAYCPPGADEIARDERGSNPRLQVDAQNCVRCKPCDIEDPTQDSNRVALKGGEGPICRRTQAAPAP